MASRKCPRCHGTGRIARHNHIKDGQCFACLGEGRIEVRAKTPQKTSQELLDELNARIQQIYS